jgi:NADH:ubiquinone oxidoreductase subunit H
MIVVLLVWTIFFVLLDELVMGTVQRRIGPLAIGFYGILSAIINGLNLAIAQLKLPKYHFNFGFKWFPVIFFSMSIFGFSINYPFFFMDNSLSILIFGFVSFFGVIFLIMSAMSGMSKYNMLGAMRLISQLLSYELV